MLRIELVPTLAHCVETAARQEYEKSVQEYLRAGEDSGELGERIELLKAFLESMDFSKLRRESESHLTQGREVRFTVYMDKGKPKYEMEVASQT
jgi:transcription elongation GreA/GreB family factor